MSSDGDRQTEHKILAARRAAELVEDGMLIGLGSGSTAELFVRELAPRIAAGLRLTAVATSERTVRVAEEIGLALVDLTGPLDLAVDGADAIERGTLAAIKGRGGALTREKLTALASRSFVLIGDDSKVATRLAEVSATMPVPVEVLPFGWQVTRTRLEGLGLPVLRERGGEPFVTDNGNHVIDLFHAPLDDAASLAEAISRVPGVIEHGLFLGIATLAIVAGERGVEELRVATSI